MAKKPKRPVVDYIQIFYKDRIPVIVDPKKLNVLVWSDEGIEVLKGFYISQGKPEMAKETEKLWNAPLKSKEPKVVKKGVSAPAEPEEEELPGAMGKQPMCFPQPLP